MSKEPKSNNYLKIAVFGQFMVEIEIHLNKSIEENASLYFEKAKRIKKKIQGAEAALAESRKKLENLKKAAEKELREELSKKTQRKKEWYEKFRWFVSSEGFLVIGGRDATSNEVVIKKYTDENDIVFHTDMAGSPFFVVKKSSRDIPIGEKTIRETADAVCSYSRVWKLGLSSSPVFYVKPEQVSKKAKSGEYMSKGSFMIYGKVNYVENMINLAIGSDKEGRIMGGPVEAVKENCEKFVEIIQGGEKASSVAKYIQHKIGGTIDEIVRALPSGGVKAKK